MARNPFGHVDLRVSSLDGALPFYEALLPALGYVHRYDSETWKAFTSEGPLPGRASRSHSRRLTLSRIAGRSTWVTFCRAKEVGRVRVR